MNKEVEINRGCGFRDCFSSGGLTPLDPVAVKLLSLDKEVYAVLPALSNFPTLTKRGVKGVYNYDIRV